MYLLALCYALYLGVYVDGKEIQHGNSVPHTGERRNPPGNFVEHSCSGVQLRQGDGQDQEEPYPTCRRL